MKNIIAALVPRAEKPNPFSCFEGSFQHKLANGILLALICSFLGHWTYTNRDGLFDQKLQNDDVYQHAFYFHQYGGEKLLAGDPVAEDMMRLAPPGHRILYRILVPIAGLFRAIKVVQGIAFAVLLAAAILIAFSARGGLAPAAFLLFLTLRSQETTIMVFGGLPRGFCTPLLALWFAGIVSRNHWVRVGTVVAGSLLYAPATVMILGFEGMYALRNGIKLRDRAFQLRMLRYAALATAAFLALVPYIMMKRPAGGPPSLAEAKVNVAFHVGGRTAKYPIPNPGPKLLWGITSSFRVQTGRPIDVPGIETASKYIALIVFMALAALLCWRKRFPPVIWACFSATVILTYLSILVAYRLYIPDRYVFFGMGSLSVFFACSCLKLELASGQKHWQLITTWVAIGGIALIWLFLGTANKSKAITVSRDTNGKLHDFVSTLPKNTRIAGHPLDCDSIPFWTGRSVVCNMETCLPWADKLWKRQSKRTQDTLGALYSTDRETFLAYCKHYNVTHILIRKGRYVTELIKRSRSFEPFTSFTGELLQSVEPKQLVINQITRQSIVHMDEHWALVEVERLKQSWATGGKVRR